MELQVNELFANRYRLLKEVGSGSFGEVWLVRDEQLDMELALKVYISLDERGIDEFKAEYKTTFGLNHPNLLKSNHFDICERRPYLAMPYCPLPSADLVGRMDEQMAWKFIRDVSSGLSYLHARDILHRDIKPDNILQNAEGDFVITDFGISMKMRSTLRRNSTRRQVAESSGGTFAYMGPEMFTGHPEAVKATDIWALGVTLYELLVGELPFMGQGGGMLLRGAEMPDLPDGFSKDLNALVRACLEKDTWDRPTAMQLHEYADARIKGRTVPCPWVKGNVSGKGVSASGTRKNGGGLDNAAAQQTMPNGNLNGKPTATGIDEPVKRHGFVRFWIWLMIVTNSLALIQSIVEFLGRPDGDGLFWMPSNMGIYHAAKIAALFGVLRLTGCLMLWKRLRLGYWVILFSLIVGTLMVSIIGAFSWYSWINPVVSSLVLLAILQIKKNGISAWKAMEPGMDWKRLRVMYSLAGVVFVVLAVLPTGLTRASLSDYPEYSRLISECKNLVEEGSASEPVKLVEARILMEDIREYEDKYGEFNDDFDRSLSLNAILQAKSKKAAEEWTAAAKAQERIGNETNAANYARLAKALSGDKSALTYYRYR